MSGSLPTTPKWRSVKITSKRYNLSSESVSGRQQVRKIGGHRWELTAVYPPMLRADFGPVLGFLMGQQGMAEVFTITPTSVSSSAGNASGSVTASAASAGATSVTISGLTGTIKGGDFIKFANHDKVYMVTADRAGAGSMTITPELVTAIESSTAVTYTNVPFTVRLANDVQDFGVATDLFASFEVDFIEAI
jgi:hypothetical protein